MTPRSAFTVAAAVSIAYALPMILAPEWFYRLYFPRDPDMLTVGWIRHLGAANFTVGLLSWGVRDVAPQPTGNRACGLLTVAMIVGAAVSAWVQARGLTNALGWSSAVVYLGFAAMFWMAGKGGASGRDAVGA
jgi:hypothetical protein